MGEIQNRPFQLSFNASLKVDFQGSRVTSDGGLIVVRELDERLGFGELIEEHLTGSRRGSDAQFPFADLSESSGLSREGKRVRAVAAGRAERRKSDLRWHARAFRS